MPSQAEIYQKVGSVLVDALNVEMDEINPAAALYADLGAEDIDLLDIVFRLEQEFGIKISRNELVPEWLLDSCLEFVEDGKVTEQGLIELRQKMPFVDISKFEKNPEFSAIKDLLTVEAVAKYIEGRLAAK